MIDIGKGVMVDFPDKPSVFLIKGLGEIRVQKGDTRINGVTRDQLEWMVEAIDEEKKPIEIESTEETIEDVIHGAIDDKLTDIQKLETAIELAETKADKKAAKKELKEYLKEH